MNNNQSIYDLDQLNKIGTKIEPIPVKEREIGIDTNDTVLQNIIQLGQEGTNSILDLSRIESFNTASQTRDQIYTMLDTMCEDTTIASALEVYTEDVTETNEAGQVMWVESDDSNIAKYIQYLLNDLNVDKNAYKQVSSLCKYGDLYLKLYRESDIKDSLFDDKSDLGRAPSKLNESVELFEKELGRKLTDEEKEALNASVISSNEEKSLNENVIITAHAKNDKYVHYVEMVSNPASIFELTKFGKSYAYIDTHSLPTYTKTEDSMLYDRYRYSFNRKDINLHQPTDYVHIALDDDITRQPEEVQIFLSDDPKASESLTYTVRRGKSIFYNVYKIWRQTTLLENAMLLNRLTKSSMVRVINVEVGEMGKEEVQAKLLRVKSLFEQKASIDANKGLSEYVNPGPVENNVYIPTRNGMGTISTQEIGGDANVTGLADVDYFKTRLYSGLRVPKQYINDTEDSTGFNGGTSLTIVSSRYAKTIKRIQNAYIQGYTDIINLILIDKGLSNYIGKFTLRMQAPTTQEELDRRDAISTQIGITSDIMNLIEVIEDPKAKLQVLKSLLSNSLKNQTINEVLEEQIELMEEQGSSNSNAEDDFDEFEGEDSFGDDFDSMGSGIHTSSPSSSDEDLDMGPTDTESSGDNELPSPADLGAGDFTDMNNEF